MGTRKLLDTAAKAEIWLYLDRATSLWVIRDRAAHKDLAVESNRRDGLIALRRVLEARA